MAVPELRAILLAPVSKFERDYPGYGVHLAQQLLAAGWPSVRGKTSLAEAARGVKKLESEYGSCLRAVVDKK